MYLTLCYVMYVCAYVCYARYVADARAHRRIHVTLCNLIVYVVYVMYTMYVMDVSNVRYVRMVRMCV